TAHPWTALLVGALPLVLLASQAPRMRSGLPRGDWLPASMESARAIEDLRAMGRQSVVQTVRVVVQFPEAHSISRVGQWSALARFAGALRGDPRIERIRSVFTVAEAAGLDWTEIVTLPEEVASPVTRGLMSPDGSMALLELVPRDAVTPGQAV